MKTSSALPSNFRAVASSSGPRYVGSNCQNHKRRFNRRTYTLAIRERPFRAQRTGPVRGAYAANPPGVREDRERSLWALTGVRRVVLGVSPIDSAEPASRSTPERARRNLSNPMIILCNRADRRGGTLQ